MPEGPKCRALTSYLEKQLKGHTLQKVQVVGGRYRRKEPEGLAEFRRKLPTKLTNIKSYGKDIWFQFDNGLFLLNHLGMEGWWTLGEEKPPYPVIHLSFDRKDLWFTDVRNFGKVKFCPLDCLLALLQSRGEDILAERMDAKRAVKLLRQHDRMKIADALLEQDSLSGVGNYLRAEILYALRLYPFSLVRNLSDGTLGEIAKMARKLAKRNLKILERDSILDEYRTILPFKVYGRDEDPYGNRVKKTKGKGGRTIHWVPEIQVKKS